MEVNHIQDALQSKILLQQVPHFLLGLWVLLQRWWRGQAAILFV